MSNKGIYMDKQWAAMRKDSDTVNCSLMPNEKALKLLKNQTSRARTFKFLKRRKQNPSVQARRRDKLQKANYRRLKLMRSK